MYVFIYILKRTNGTIVCGVKAHDNLVVAGQYTYYLFTNDQFTEQLHIN